MDEMTGTGQQGERARRDRIVQTMSAVYWDPGVVLTPHDVGRDGDGAEQRFEFSGEALVGLRHLTIEGRLSLVVAPGLCKRCKVFHAETALARTGDVGLKRSAMHGRGQLRKDGRVLLDQGEEWRAPRPERYDIDKA